MSNVMGNVEELFGDIEHDDNNYQSFNESKRKIMHLVASARSPRTLYDRENQIQSSSEVRRLLSFNDLHVLWVCIIEV